MAKTKKEKIGSFKDNNMDYTLLIVILLLLSLGLIMVLSASSPTAISEGSSSYKYFVKQGLFAIVGLFAMYVISKIDYRIYKKFYKLGYIVSIILLALVLVIGKELNGATRWIYIGPLSLQPSEIVKLLMIILYAAVLTRDKDELSSFWKGIVKHALYLIPIVLLLILEPHFSATIVIVGVCVLMMVFAGCKLWKMVIPGAVAAGGQAAGCGGSEDRLR